MNREAIIKFILGMVVERLTAEQLKKFADMALDFAEDQIKSSATTVDDTFVLPVIQKAREAFDIPDED